MTHRWPMIQSQTTDRVASPLSGTPPPLVDVQSRENRATVTLDGRRAHASPLGGPRAAAAARTALLMSPGAEDVALDGTDAVKAPSSATHDERRIE